MFYAVITIPIDPVFHVGPIPLHWYGVGYAVAFLVALGFAERHVARRGIDRDQAASLAFWTIVFGLIGARLYFDVQSGALYYLTHPQYILAAWQGGMAFFGAIFFSLGTLLFLSWRRKLDYWVLFDAGAIFAGVGQPIGRIGNLINGDILGPVSNLPWATRYTNPHTLAPLLGVAYQPAAAYEALCTLLILAILLLLRRRGVPAGALGLTYLALYPISQFGIFFLRATEPMLWLGLKQAQWTSIGVFVVGLPLAILAWWYTRRRRARQEPAPAGLTPI
ncbi:MAG: prolipoprotein diacylglyceryl transferase [Candidatus Dormibacteraceae bacterium]